MSRRWPGADAARVARALAAGTPVYLLTSTDAPGDPDLFVGDEGTVREELTTWLGEPLPAGWTLTRVAAEAQEFLALASDALRQRDAAVQHAAESERAARETAAALALEHARAEELAARVDELARVLAARELLARGPDPVPSTPPPALEDHHA